MDWVNELKDVDFIEVRNQFADMFRIAQEEAAKNNEAFCIQNELANVLYPFMNNPCLETAIFLLEKYPNYLPYFRFQFTSSVESETAATLGATISKGTSDFVSQVKDYYSNSLGQIDISVFLKLTLWHQAFTIHVLNRMAINALGVDKAKKFMDLLRGADNYSMGNYLHRNVGDIDKISARKRYSDLINEVDGIYGALEMITKNGDFPMPLLMQFTEDAIDLLDNDSRDLFTFVFKHSADILTSNVKIFYNSLQKIKTAS